MPFYCKTACLSVWRCRFTLKNPHLDFNFHLIFSSLHNLTIFTSISRFILVLLSFSCIHNVFESRPLHLHFFGILRISHIGTLKGQCHEIFECCFLRKIASLGPIGGTYSGIFLKCSIDPWGQLNKILSESKREVEGSVVSKKLRNERGGLWQIININQEKKGTKDGPLRNPCLYLSSRWRHTPQGHKLFTFGQISNEPFQFYTPVTYVWKFGFQNFLVTGVQCLFVNSRKLKL